MNRTALLKVRVLPATKAAIDKAAKESGVTLSVILRDLTNEYVVGRSYNPAIRADMLVVRQAGNKLLDLAEAAGDNASAARLRDVGHRLRDITKKHLGPS